MENTRPANEAGWLLKILISWLSSTLITTAATAAAWGIAFWVELFGPAYEEAVMIWLLVGPFLSWPIIGLFQLAIFGSRIRGKVLWVLLTGLAWIITFSILVTIFPSLFAGGSRSLTMHPALLAFISGILIGAAFGFLQWLVLRRTVISAGSWILTWIVAWVLSLLLLQYLSQLPLPLQDPQKLKFLVLAGALMIGMVAGGGYTWMFHPSVRKIPVLAGLIAIPLIFALGLAVPLTTAYSQQSRLLRPTHGLANVLDISFSADGSMLAAVTNVATGESENRGLAIWDVASGKEIARLQTSADRLTLLPDGKQIVTAGPLHNPVAIWEIASGEQLSTISEQANDIAVSGDGKLLAIATGNYQEAALVLWDLSAGKELKRLRTTLAVYHVAFSPNGKFVAMGLGGLGQNQMRVLDIEHSSPRLIVPDLPGGVISPAFSPDGSRVLFGTGKTIEVWSIDREKRVALLSVGGNVGTLALSPDGKIIAVARGQLERDKSIYLYDSATGQLLNTLKGHTQPVTSLAFSPDGHYLASGSWDGTLRLWEILSDN